MIKRMKRENKMTNDRGLEKKRGVSYHDKDHSSVDSVEKFVSLIGSSQKEKSKELFHRVPKLKALQFNGALRCFALQCYALHIHSALKYIFRAA